MRAAVLAAIRGKTKVTGNGGLCFGGGARALMLHAIVKFASLFLCGVNCSALPLGAKFLHRKLCPRRGRLDRSAITHHHLQQEETMTTRIPAILSAATILMGLAFAAPAHALTMKECSVKYKAAESAGTLNGMKWNDFRKAQCGADAAAATQAPAATPTPAKAAKSATKDNASAALARGSDATFPTAVSSKYSSESAGKARMHTCLDQYNANKTSGGNGSLKWIQKGGGYYSECNKRLSER